MRTMVGMSRYLDRPLALPQKVALVCLETVQGVTVFAGIDGNGFDAQLGRRPEDAIAISLRLDPAFLILWTCWPVDAVFIRVSLPPAEGCCSAAIALGL